MEPMTALGFLKNALDLVKGAKDLAQQPGAQGDVLGKITELQKELADGYTASLELIHETYSLKDQIREKDKVIEDLNEKLSFQKRLTFLNDAYWVIEEDEVKEGPFCSGCWVQNKIASPLQKTGAGRVGYSRCPVCKCEVKPFSPSG